MCHRLFNPAQQRAQEEERVQRPTAEEKHAQQYEAREERRQAGTERHAEERSVELEVE